jgi:SH3-like domain-containing protein
MKAMARILALLLCLLPPVSLSAQAGKAKEMSVQVKITEIRSSPSYTAKVLAKLSYGDRLAILETKGAWVRAKSPNGKAEGWISLSALTAKRVVLSAGGETKTGVDSSEVALAGKGFNKEVEAQYKADGKVDYAWVDKMESFNVSMEDRTDFLVSGGLAAKGEE